MAGKICVSVDVSVDNQVDDTDKSDEKRMILQLQ